MDKKISVFVVSSNKRILLLKTNPIKYEKIYWSIVNGGVDDGETFEEAAIRETFEETGFKIKNLQFSGYSCTYEYPKGNLRTKKVFIGFVENENVKLSNEHEEFKWIDTEDFKKNFSWPDPEGELDKILLKIKNFFN